MRRNDVLGMRIQGLSVIPMGQDKSPLAGFRWKPFQNQLMIPQDIVKVWPMDGGPNVAIVTGALSGVIVLDVDVRDDQDGFASVKANGWTIPKTPTVKTGGGGRHFYFSHPGFPIANKVGIAPGLDVRGDGGLAIAPPSIHENGEAYRWEIPFRRADLAPMPAWLIEQSRASIVGFRSTHSDDLDAAEVSSDYGRAALAREVEAVRNAPRGERNNQFFQSAANLAELSSELTADDRDEILDAARFAGLEEKEIFATYQSAVGRGSQRPRSRPVEEIAPQNQFQTIELAPPNTSGLAARTMSALRDTFAQDVYQHAPSEQQFSGLEQIALAIEAMAKGRLASALHVSYMPPGSGKTSTLTHAVRLLVSDNTCDDIGVIVFLSRCDEIAKLASGMGLSKDDFAVLTSQEEFNDLGASNRGEARVLFTTQQQLQARAQGTKSFSEMDVFWFRERPRQVRVWDEAILSSQPLTLGRYDLDRLRQGFVSDDSSEIASAIEDLSEQLKAASSGDLLEVPALTKRYRSLNTFRHIFKPGEREIAETFWRLNGRKVRVLEDDYWGNVILDHRDILPTGLAPMLVLDASAEQRKVYSLWEERRGGLAFLKSSVKSYRGLTIHHWNKGAGKTTQEKDKDNDVARGVAKTINRDISSGDPVLVVHFKSDRKDFEVDTRTLLSEREGVVSFCHWGLHTATNEYSHIRHVILAGLLNYSPAQFEAAARGAADVGVDEELQEGDLEAVRLGELAHHMYQAANRGLVRKSVGDECPDDVHLYVVFSSIEGKGVPAEILQRVFPGATITNWKPIYTLSGEKQKGLVEIVIQHNKDWGRSIDRAELMKTLDIKDANQLRVLCKNENVVGYLEERGITLTIGPTQILLSPRGQRLQA